MKHIKRYVGNVLEKKALNIKIASNGTVRIYLSEENLMNSGI